ncbi:MAG: gliding motility-associated C-terminal domain-containing protein [Chitinophagaceae bacterium]|nr:gliding motility-associated C-terminal domain-containing protein [Chitinophagaceae bacterium]
MKTRIILGLFLSLLWAQSYAQGGIESGLVAKYCFTGNANDALGVRNATVFGATLTADRFGNPNAAYSLDGVNDYIQMPDAIWISGDFSFSGWLNLNNQSSWSRFFEWGNGIDKDNVFYCPYQSGQQVFTIHKCSSSARTYAYNASPVTTGAWIHVAITLSNDTVRVYRNNVFSYQYKMADTPCSVVRTQCYFGKSNFSNPYLDAKIDDIRIYDRAITVAEIDTLYKLTDCSAAVVIDPCAGTKADFKDINTACYTFDFKDLSLAKDSGIVSWNWSFGDGGTATTQNPTHSYPDYGTYNVRLIVRDSSGCIDTFSKPVTIAYTHFADAGRDTTICLLNGTATTFLRGNRGAATYAWTPIAGLSHSGSSNTYATLSVPTTYYLSSTDSFGCIDKDSVFVNLFASPILKATPKDTSVCAGTMVQYAATGAVRYLWSPSTNLNNDTIANPKLKVTVPASYTVQGTDANGCIGFDTVKVRIEPSVVLVAQPQTSYACANATVQLSASGAEFYKWTPAEGLSADSIANPVATVTKNQTYYVTGKSLAGCEGYDSVMVSLFPNPVVDAYSSENFIKCRGGSIRLNVTGATSYEWQPAEYCDDNTSKNPMVNPRKTTQFTVTGTNDVGCSASDTISVIFEGEVVVYMPNAFTPNGDGINDRFGVIDNCNFNFQSIHIYDRWGQVLFASNNPIDKWDGNHNGKKCILDVYFYLVKGTDLEDNEVIKAGDFTLLR